MCDLCNWWRWIIIFVYYSCICAVWSNDFIALLPEHSHTKVGKCPQAAAGFAWLGQRKYKILKAETIDPVQSPRLNNNEKSEYGWKCVAFKPAAILRSVNAIRNMEIHPKLFICKMCANAVFAHISTKFPVYSSCKYHANQMASEPIYFERIGGARIHKRKGGGEHTQSESQRAITINPHEPKIVCSPQVLCDSFCLHLLTHTLDALRFGC